MGFEKKYRENIILFFTILVSVIRAFDEIIPNRVPIEKEALCLPASYSNPNVKDRPELLIVQATSLIDDDFLPMWMGVCRMESKESENLGKLLGRFDPADSNELEYDVQTDTIYESTYSYKLRILNNGGIKDVFEYRYSDVFTNINKHVYSVALDWVTKNLYVLLDDQIQIYNIKDNMKSPKTIMYFDNPVLSPSVKVFPNEGYFIVKTGNTIIRLNQDGSNPHVLYGGSDKFTMYTIALDYFEKKVYWIETRDWGKYGRIRSTDLNGKDIKTFKEYHNDYITCFKEILQIDEKYVYFTKGLCTENNLFRARKIDGSMDLDFELMENSTPRTLNGKFNSILVVSGNPQVIAKDHPCQYNNGDCKGFCVAIPNEFNNLSKKCLDTCIKEKKIIKIV